MRHKVLKAYGQWPQGYSCCQSYFGCCCISNETIGGGCCGILPSESAATACCCLCLETWCCAQPAIQATRFYVMDKKQLAPDPCDNRIIAFSNCLQCLACICEVAHARTPMRARTQMHAPFPTLICSPTSLASIATVIPIRAFLRPHTLSCVRACACARSNANPSTCTALELFSSSSSIIIRPRSFLPRGVAVPKPSPRVHSPIPLPSPPNP
mmetsp:Transcript_21537/g.47037  ORF Transcript_21537/g.47037 Transcript_21537/m.47037 type:complete len:212 (-) Transcript_21537:4-639(-)